MTLPLSEHQQNALIEIFNIGVRQAASCMSHIAGEEISLSVPKLDILCGADQADAIKTAIRSPRICAISQDFTGSLNARAFLIFPEGKTQEIVRRMIGEPSGTDELSVMEQEALSEIGNIILNSCISSLPGALQDSFHCSLPAYHMGSADEILFADNARDDDLLMLFYMRFPMSRAHIDGYLVFLLNPPSFNTLIKQVDQLLRGPHGNGN